MHSHFVRAAISVAGIGLMATVPLARPAVEILEPVFALPAHVVNQFKEPATFVVTSAGDYLVLDRRAHTVHRVDRQGRTVTSILEVGHEAGRILRPSAIALSDDDILAVLDAPGAYERLQYFSPEGMRIGGFYLPSVRAPTVTVGAQLVSGDGGMAFDGQHFWFNRPAWGALMSEMDSTGQVLGHVGVLRPTGFESNGNLHHALNAGFPIVDPTGGMYFVFQSGRPMLRKYDARGALSFERHIEGPELDPIIQRLPTRWDTPADGSRPLPAPVVRAAAADRQGRLWVALQTGHLYVYDESGEKIRTVTLGGPAPELVSSLFFTRAGRLLTGPAGYEFDATATAVASR